MFRELGQSGVKLRAAYGRGFRVPTISEIESHNQFSPPGSPDLVPEWVDSYEAGIDYRARGGGLILSGTYFYQSKHNQISYQGANQASPER